MKDLETRYLERLSDLYPTIAAASTEIINLQAILNLPKGTEHFLTDVHGEYEAFSHVLKNGSGSVKRKIEEVFGNTLSAKDKKSLATLIYYPKEKMSIVRKTETNMDDWYRVNLYRLIQVSKRAASKYTRSKVRKSLPKDFAYVIEELITEKTRGILICNPNNPSGSLYSREEMEMLGDIVRRHGIFLFADEVYREFVYDGMEFFSAGHLKGVDEHVVIFDSMSKRFSECGIRIGAVISKNRPVAEGFLKLAQARLSPPLIGQIVAEASFSAGHAYLDPIAAEYQRRRDVLIEGLRNIPGVNIVRPQGAFYVIASLPVKNAEDFCAWCLTDFSDNGETVMMAPASGFYITPGLGPSEVRIAYVLKSDDLRRATELLAKALRQYSRHVPGERTSA